jgi:hypothetical protein
MNSTPAASMACWVTASVAFERLCTAAAQHRDAAALARLWDAALSTRGRNDEMPTLAELDEVRFALRTLALTALAAAENLEDKLEQIRARTRREIEGDRRDPGFALLEIAAENRIALQDAHWKAKAAASGPIKSLRRSKSMRCRTVSHAG